MIKAIINSIINDPNLLIATGAVFTSFVSIIIGVVALYIQRSHNKKSVLPIGNISVADYEDCLRIRIANNGVGPLIIKSCKTKKDNISKPYPIDWMPSDIIWKTFSKNLENRAILPGRYITLLEFTVNLENTDEIKKRDLIRSILKDLEIEITYSDVYERNFKISRKLNWFERNI